VQPPESLSNDLNMLKLTILSQWLRLAVWLSIFLWHRQNG